MYSHEVGTQRSADIYLYSVLNYAIFVYNANTIIQNKYIIMLWTLYAIYTYIFGFSIW